MARTVCKVLGFFFVLTGLSVAVFGGQVDKYHNLLHLVTGVIALGFGFGRSLSGAKGFCLGFGVFYLVLGLLGMVLGDPTTNRLWHVGPLRLATGDHGFHIVLGAILLASGLLSKATVSRPTEQLNSRQI